ncbi:Protein of unknown function [Pyronema omphalodes CBS 100304]|uniref:Uncharacterized protein n=1 Tax=Pyronema omphalodes (strain CBS 100304) TaxID=1076935 RepID=U4L0L7_PYROM|nr:Protein of unknown function [Pyronema omphalodes CBS 100304]
MEKKDNLEEVVCKNGLDEMIDSLITLNVRYRIEVVSTPAGYWMAKKSKVSVGSSALTSGTAALVRGNIAGSNRRTSKKTLPAFSNARRCETPFHCTRAA